MAVDAQARPADMEPLEQSLTRYSWSVRTPSGRGRPALELILTLLARRGLTVAGVGPGLDGRLYRYLQRVLRGFRLGDFVIPDTGRQPPHGFCVTSARKTPRRERSTRIRREFAVGWSAGAERVVGLRRLDSRAARDSRASGDVAG
jgi:hypothetical protein